MDGKWIYTSKYIELHGNREFSNYSWVSKSNLEVTYLGEAKDGVKKGIILASFNAG